MAGAEGLKWCRGCEQSLPLTSYYKSRRGVLGSTCRECDRARGAAKRKDMPAKEKWAFNRKHSLKTKYGWTLAAFERQLARQNSKCHGCFGAIDMTAHVDHCHETDRIRGLLCGPCNRALGHVQDNPETLRRLMSHLEYKLEDTRVYLVGALKNPRIPVIGNAIRAKNFDVMDEWFTPGEHADENWQAYEKLRGRTYVQAIKGRAARNIFLFDKVYLEHSDVVVLVMPAGKSAMLELGYAGGLGKKTVLFLDGAEPERYDVMPGMADHIVKTMDELFDVLEGYRV